MKITVVVQSHRRGYYIESDHQARVGLQRAVIEHGNLAQRRNLVYLILSGKYRNSLGLLLSNVQSRLLLFALYCACATSLQLIVQVGDQILELNGQSFLDITHDEAVMQLKYNKKMSLLLRDVGKIPCVCQPIPRDWDACTIG